MTITFVAVSTWVDPNIVGYDCLSALVWENADGTGFTLYFEAALAVPDAADVAEGRDTYCLIMSGQRSAYGCVDEIALRERVLRIVIAPEALKPLGFNDNTIEATLEVEDAAVEQLRLALRKILTYGRPDARPKVMCL